MRSSGFVHLVAVSLLGCGTFALAADPAPPTASVQLVAATSSGADGTRSPPLAAPAPARSEAAPDDTIMLGGPNDVDGNWSLGQRQAWTRHDARLNDFVLRAQRACGGPITARYVRETFREPMAAGGDQLDTHAQSTCQMMVNAVELLCRSSEMARQSVVARVHALECAWGPTAHGLAGGTYRLRFNTREMNAAAYRDGVTQFLRQQL